MRVSGALLMGLLVLTAGVTAATPEASGRWKLGGDGGCYSDATDDGPDQVCTCGWLLEAGRRRDSPFRRDRRGAPSNARRPAALPRGD